jgi:hypothetical protein
MLPVIDVTIGIQESTDRVTDTLNETSVENESRVQEQTGLAMELIVLEASHIDVAISHTHLTFCTHVIPPGTFVSRTIHPGHLALSLSLTSLPISVIGGFFVLGTSHARNTVEVLHKALSTWSTILEVAFIFIAVFVVNDSLTIIQEIKI